jgi:hypothetical protein
MILTKTMKQRTTVVISLLSAIALESDRAGEISFHPTIQTFVEQPYALLHSEGVQIPQDFAKNNIRAEQVRITLSNFAEGCTNLGITYPELYDRAKECVETTAEIAMDPQLSPYQQPIEEVENLDGHGIYLSHLNIVLGAWKRLTGDDRYDGINKRISEHLAKESLADATYQISSYPEGHVWGKFRFPADQTATLYSLYLYDNNYDTDLSTEPIEEWLAFMEKEGTDSQSSLHISEITGTYPSAGVPRGCALSWSVRYMASFAPEEAEKLWTSYKAQYKQNYGVFTAFREWPVGIEGEIDADTGPIILGNGFAATAFASGASRAVGDIPTYIGLSVTEESAKVVVDMLSRYDPTLQTLAESSLGVAIQLNGDTTISWY